MPPPCSMIIFHYSFSNIVLTNNAFQDSTINIRLRKYNNWHPIIPPMSNLISFLFKVSSFFRYTVMPKHHGLRLSLTIRIQCHEAVEFHELDPYERRHGLSHGHGHSTLGGYENIFPQSWTWSQRYEGWCHFPSHPWS